MGFIDGPNSVAGTLIRFAVLVATSIHEEYASPDFALGSSPKRLLVLLILIVVYPALLLWNYLGIALDDILFPAWRDCEVEKPLFIVGNARSGTTLMHRMLSLNEEHFTFFRTWEILFGVSVTWRMTFLVLARIDGILGGPTALLVDAVERLTVRDIKVHAVGLQLAEEDEWLMMWICKAQLLMMPFPLAGDLLGDLVLFDEKVSPDTRTDIMVFYKECVRRHVYARALWSGRPNRRFVSKNPPFTLRITSLRTAFPSCRVACMLRDPIDSVPSMVSYIAKTWRAFASPLIAYPRFHDLVGFCMAHYMHPLSRLPHRYVPTSYGKHIETHNRGVEESGKQETRDEHGGQEGDWGCFVEYSALASKSLGPVVLETLQLLGYISQEVSLQYRARLEAEELKARTHRHRAGHSYTLEDTCHVSAAGFREMFRDVYRVHRF